ncbi:MAG: hypothetical protein WA192_13280 [Candidatus Acidiferrales bacterium]
MSEKTADENRSNRKLPLYAALGALAAFVVCIPILLCPPDISLLLILVVGALLLLASVAWLISAAIRGKRSQFLAFLTMLAIFWSISAALVFYDVKNGSVIRSAARWLVWSRDYQAKVLAQPPAANGKFRHIEWDGWGWAGMDTTVYLVFDPTDSLAPAAASRWPGHFKGIPCAVLRVRRLQSRWYTVLFYTDEFWSNCNQDAAGN